MYSCAGTGGLVELVDVIWILIPKFFLQLSTYFNYCSFSEILANIYFDVYKEVNACCVKNGYFF
jgi:hypothetical protein